MLPVSLMFNKKNKNNFGFGIIEIIIGSAIISLSFLGLMAVANISLKVLEENSHNLKAAFLLEEGIEAVKILRDTDWSQNIATLSTGTNYYFEFNGTTWQATTNNTYIDGLFERRFVVENVYRDSNDDIAASGTVDPNTKKITVYVSWPEKGATKTKYISTYISNLFE